MLYFIAGQVKTCLAYPFYSRKFSYVADTDYSAMVQEAAQEARDAWEDRGGEDYMPFIHEVAREYGVEPRDVFAQMNRRHVAKPAQSTRSPQPFTELGDFLGICKSVGTRPEWQRGDRRIYFNPKELLPRLRARLETYRPEGVTGDLVAFAVTTYRERLLNLIMYETDESWETYFAEHWPVVTEPNPSLLRNGTRATGEGTTLFT